MLSDTSIEALADRILEAENIRTAMPPLTEAHPELSERDAYRIQDAVVDRKRDPIGYKLGFTGAAMREQMGVESPNYGRLTTAMRADNGTIELSKLIHPRVEPEIALLTASELHGPGLNLSDVRQAVSHLCAALEVVDSRYIDYRFRAADNTADNSSAARFVLGAPVPVACGTEPAAAEVVLQCNGVVVDKGRGENALGDPFAALLWLAERLGEHGATLPQDSLILTGGLTRSHAVEAGDVFVGCLDGIGRVAVRFVGER